MHLATRLPSTGDSHAMLIERQLVLASGVFDPLYARLVELTTGVIADATSPVVADIGAGTGALIARLVEISDGTVGITVDVSSAAARIAQRSHPRVQAVVADAWQDLPILAGQVTVLTSVFAPRNPTGFYDALHPDGRVVVVSAGADHQVELRERFPMLRIETGKTERIETQFATLFSCETIERLRWQVPVDDTLAYALIAMGPNAHHATVRRDDVMFTSHVTCDVMLHVFRKQPH